MLLAAAANGERCGPVRALLLAVLFANVDSRRSVIAPGPLAPTDYLLTSFSKWPPNWKRMAESSLFW
jgi:hypothetical protein